MDKLGRRFNMVHLLRSTSFPIRPIVAITANMIKLTRQPGIGPAAVRHLRNVCWPTIIHGGIMRKKILILGLMVVSTVLTLPMEGFARAGNKPASVGSSGDTQISVTIGQPRRRRRIRRNGRWVWVSYRSPYYRRNRYRLVRRYYWDDGFRRTRMVRVYY